MKELVGFVTLLFIGWLLFGGLFEDQSEYDAENTIHVDCSGTEAKYNSYCNGDYEQQIQEERGREDNYYQNIVH